ncbi:unnamed protein product [Alopecurus aequalis]
MAALAPAPSRPFVVLDERVRYQNYYDWRMVECECESSVAYGCGPLGQQIVDGLTLLAGLGFGDDDEDHLPRLAVHALDEVLQRFEEEVRGELARSQGIKVAMSGKIEAVDDEGGVLVLRLSFIDRYTNHDLRSYYLVYDREAASLSLLPYHPTHCRTVYDRCPLLVRTHGGDGYSLVLTADWDGIAGDELGRHVLCLWAPSLHDGGDAGVGPWRIRQQRHAMAVPDMFNAARAFTYKGKAFWADLAQGILYCECADLLDDDASAVQFTFVALPDEYRVDDPLDEELGFKRRAMGVGVGDSVWFVVLESCDHPGDTTVVVLSLDLSDGAVERRWKRHLELSLLSIWALEGFVEAGLPRRVPWSPFLREQDAGIIYLLLPVANMKSEEGCHLIGIDVRDRSQPRLLPPRRLLIVPIFNYQPVLLPPEFFDTRPSNQEEALSLSQPSSIYP